MVAMAVVTYPATASEERIFPLPVLLTSLKNVERVKIKKITNGLPEFYS